MDITQSYLKSILHYDPETGVFTWRYRPETYFTSGRGYTYFNSRYAGNEAGSKRRGYIVVDINKFGYYAHRLAFLYMTGSFPLFYVDHVNQLKHDNRWGNLRPATPLVNSKNIKKRKDNSSGIMGVYFDRRRGKFLARIGENRKQTHLGCFDSIFDAICARKSAEIKLGFHVNHGKADS
jgi:hypothetical protein